MLGSNFLRAAFKANIPWGLLFDSKHATCAEVENG